MSSLFYQYLRPFDWFFKIFGLKKPFPDRLGNPSRVTYLNKFWSFLILVLLVTSYAFSAKEVDFNIKRNLYWICQTNEIIVATASILMNLFEGEEVCAKLYETINIILNNLVVSNEAIKIFCFKLLLNLLIPFSVYLLCLILEIATVEPPFYLLVTRIPIFMSIIHFLIHNWVMIAAIDAVNRKITKILTVMVNDGKNECLKQEGRKIGLFKYLLRANVKFIEIDVTDEKVDLKLICRIYDELCTCVKLLEMHHGYQAIPMLWLSFSSTVCITTLIICQQTEHPLMLALICVLPFYWALLCANMDHQMRCQVDRLENVVIKLLINFRCDQPRKNILQVLKQQVTSNRLQLVICGFFGINYSIILGTVMNVITYTIILVQVFLRVD